eukprot:4312965-Amphidinium_carterae.2
MQNPPKITGDRGARDRDPGTASLGANMATIAICVSAANICYYTLTRTMGTSPGSLRIPYSQRVGTGIHAKPLSPYQPQPIAQCEPHKRNTLQAYITCMCNTYSFHLAPSRTNSGRLSCLAVREYKQSSGAILPRKPRFIGHEAMLESFEP